MRELSRIAWQLAGGFGAALVVLLVEPISKPIALGFVAFLGSVTTGYLFYAFRTAHKAGK